ncbi:ATP-grasp domain-containing protein [Cytophaga aurantiaca]|uniref:ATP-grasp domain-containing protein n=1 Tax=Cytophaga aurantiaca TaxID=29530 RepID=UPI000362DFF6|nr:ATP-grasp domain-containing protein [Cytophaga aurantiaca]
MKVINILFLGGAKRVSLAEKLIQAGLERNCSVHIYSYELDMYVPIASVGSVIKGLKWSSPDLYANLSEIIKSKQIHTVLPFVDAAIAVTSKLALLHPELYFPVSDLEIADVMFDKVTANTWFIDHQLPVPPQNESFPLIAKPRKGSASKGIFVLQDKDDADYFEKKNDRNDFLIQKFIPGIEYTVDCYISRESKLISVVPRMRAEVTSGEATQTITVKDEQIITLSEKILSKGKFKGPITIQFIRDAKTLETYIMEINPRFGGGVLASIEAGANSAQVLIDELLGLPVNVNTSWKENIIMTRSFRETYFYADNH